MSTLSLNAVQKQQRSELKRGFRIDLYRDKHGKEVLETTQVGLCLDAPRSNSVKDTGVKLWKDLLPQERKRLRQERAKRKAGRKDSLQERILKLTGMHSEALANMKHAANQGNHREVSYLQQFAGELKSKINHLEEVLRQHEARELLPAVSQ